MVINNISRLVCVVSDITRSGFTIKSSEKFVSDYSTRVDWTAEAPLSE